MSDDKVCTERHDNCKSRFDSQDGDIKNKLPSRTFYWVTGFIILILVGGYKYTHSVEASVHELDKDIQHVVTKTDMEKYQKQMIQAIKEAIE